MKKWTKEEIDYIVNNHGKIFIKEIARDLGRTKGSVSKKINHLGLHLSFEELSSTRKRINLNKGNSLDGPNLCINCGKKVLNTRRFCSKECQSDFQYNKKIEDWKAGVILGHREGDIFLRLRYFVRRYIFEKYENKCCRCGFSECNPYDGLPILQINHIDGKAENSVESNLELLCPNCHALTHNYGARNKESKRKRFRASAHSSDG